MCRKNSKSVTCLLSFLFCLITVFALTGVKSEAAAKAPSCAKTQTVYIFTDDNNNVSFDVATGFIYIKNLTSNAKITNIKCSNKELMATSVKKTKYGRDMDAVSVMQNYNYSYGYGEKCGLKDGTKAKVSFTVKQNGKSYKLSCTITLKVASPFKSIKIGNKEYANKVNGYSYKENLKWAKSGNVKISVKMKSGYKVDFLWINGKKVKNGSTISAKNLKDIDIYYSTTKKPANYKKPAKWGNAVVQNELQQYVSLSR